MSLAAAGLMDAAPSGGSVSISISDGSYCDADGLTAHYGANASWNTNSGTRYALYKSVWSGTASGGSTGTGTTSVASSVTRGTVTVTIYGINNAGVQVQVGTASLFIVNPCTGK